MSQVLLCSQSQFVIYFSSKFLCPKMKSSRIFLLILIIAVIAVSNSSSNSVQGVICRCGRMYDPVCANDGSINKTYDNECILECEQRSAGTGRMPRKVYEGACRTDGNEM